MQSTQFLEALKFAQARNVVLPSEFYSLDLKTRQLATTVSFLSSIEQIKSVIQSVNKAIANGSTFDDFKQEVSKSGIKLSSNYLDLVFRQNVQTAYSFGRWTQQENNSTTRPYLMYSAIDDDRVRPEHLALNGIIRRVDDPFWQMYYPPWAFRCRCSVISLSQEQAEKIGITPDDQLPQLATDLGFTTSPMTFGEMSNLVHEKIMNSGLDTSLFDKPLQSVEAEWSASKKLSSLLSPMTNESRDLFHSIFETVLPLDPDIRPSAIKTLLDYVQGNDQQLSAYLNHTSNTLADDVLKRWLMDDMARLKQIAVNEQDTVIGGTNLSYVASFQKDEVITLDAPLFMDQIGGDVVLNILGAKGLGIDVEKLNAGQGVLFEIGLSFEVVSIEHQGGKTIYTLNKVD